MRWPIIVGCAVLLAAAPARPGGTGGDRWAVGWFRQETADLVPGDLSYPLRQALQVRRGVRAGWDLTVILGYGRNRGREVTTETRWTERGGSVAGDNQVISHSWHHTTVGLRIGRRLVDGGSLSLWGEGGWSRYWSRGRREWLAIRNGAWGPVYVTDSHGHGDLLDVGLRIAWRAGRHWRLETRWGWYRQGSDRWNKELRSAGSPFSRRSGRSRTVTWGTYGWTGEQSLSILYAF